MISLAEIAVVNETGSRIAGITQRPIVQLLSGRRAATASVLVNWIQSKIKHWCNAAYSLTPVHHFIK